MTKTVSKSQKTTTKLFKSPTSKSERIVVDEIIEGEDGRTMARLLRARRSKNCATDDLSIDAWDPEEEDFINAWQVAAFVGFPSSRLLREGDVFFIADGSKLSRTYGTSRDAKYKKPLPRDMARKTHLLRPWDESKELARTEIKKEFCKLSAVRLSRGAESEIKELIEAVEEKFREQSSESMKGENDNG